MHEPIIRTHILSILRDGGAGIVTTACSIGAGFTAAMMKLAGADSIPDPHIFAQASPVVATFSMSDLISVVSVVGTVLGGWLTKVLLARAEVRRAVIEDEKERRMAERERLQAERDERRAQREERESEERSRLALHLEQANHLIEFRHREIMQQIEEMRARASVAVTVTSSAPAEITTATPGPS